MTFTYCAALFLNSQWTCKEVDKTSFHLVLTEWATTGNNLKTKIYKEKKTDIRILVCTFVSDSQIQPHAAKQHNVVLFFQLCYSLFMQEVALLQPKKCVLGNTAN